MIEWLGQQGAQVIEVNTDGIYFVPPAVARASSLRGETRKQDARATSEDLRERLAKELPSVATTDELTATSSAR